MSLHIQPENRPYYAQLQGLRGIAVLMVIVSHFLIVPVFHKLTFIGLGFWGVNTFFVLSGFLITGVLLNDIDNYTDKETLLKRFFYRRTLRIFPIYYLTLVLLFVFNIGNTRQVAPFTFTYTYNIANVFSGVYSEPVSHFWSLCVEEQFYLLWPFLLLLFRKRVLRLILSMIVLGVCSRVLHTFPCVTTYDNIIWFTGSCLDCLGAGALLAWMRKNKPELLERILKQYMIPVVVVIIALVISYLYYNTLLFTIIGRLLSAVAGFFVIGIAANGNRYTGVVLNNRFLTFTGSISYGLYVYHMVMYFLLHEYLNEAGKCILPGVLKYHTYLFTFVVCVGLSYMVSYISFIFIEKPIMGMKNKRFWVWGVSDYLYEKECDRVLSLLAAEQCPITKDVYGQWDYLSLLKYLKEMPEHVVYNVVAILEMDGYVERVLRGDRLYNIKIKPKGLAFLAKGAYLIQNRRLRLKDRLRSIQAVVLVLGTLGGGIVGIDYLVSNEVVRSILVSIGLSILAALVLPILSYKVKTSILMANLKNKQTRRKD